MSSSATATIPEFPGYIMHRDGKIVNRHNNVVGSKQNSYWILNMKHIDGTIRKCRHHIMIMWAFSGEAPNGREVDHINRDTCDNRFENLQYMSVREHRQKTNNDNSDKNKLSAVKRGKRTLGIKEGAQHEFDTILEAERQTGVKESSIRYSINSKKSVDGWLFSFPAEPEKEWKELKIDGLEQIIYLSPDGYVKSVRVITQGNLKNNYYKFTIKLNGKLVNKGVHELVCIAFHGPKPEGMTSVNHKDNDTLNNHYTNLEWSNELTQSLHAMVSNIICTKDDIRSEFTNITDAAAFVQSTPSIIYYSLDRNINGFLVEIVKKTKPPKHLTKLESVNTSEEASENPSTIPCPVLSVQVSKPELCVEPNTVVEKHCIGCNQTKVISLFETGRTVCKECRKISRKTSREEKQKTQNEVDPLTAEHPDACYTCNKAFTPEAFRWRKETLSWRPTCKDCYNKYNYHIQHREKKRADNEADYLKHNAEVQKNWRNNNVEHVAQWRTQNVNYRLRAIKQQASVKGLTWCDTMSHEVCETMMTSPCFYCSFLSTKTVNGIDRMDNKSHYTIANCVPCCKRCNFMKTALDANTFVKRCMHISLCHGGTGELQPITLWMDSNCVSYSEYSIRATKKNIQFELTNEDFKNITGKSCTYCQKEQSLSHNNGIDRADNSIGYTLVNSLPCCGECNYMKRDLLKDDFIKQCIQIASMSHTIPDMPQCTSALGRTTP